MDLLGGILDPIFGNPQKDAAEKQRNDVTFATQEALRRLSPEFITQLTQLFMPQIMQQISPMLQTQVQGLNANLAQRGMAESGVGATAEAGLRGQAVNNAAQQAFQQAMANASGQAGIITGAFMPGISGSNQMLGQSRSGLDQLSQAMSIAMPFLGAGGIPGGGGGGGFQAPPGMPIANQAGSGQVWM